MTSSLTRRVSNAVESRQWQACCSFHHPSCSCTISDLQDCHNNLAPSEKSVCCYHVSTADWPPYGGRQPHCACLTLLMWSRGYRCCECINHNHASTEDLTHCLKQEESDVSVVLIWLCTTGAEKISTVQEAADLIAAQIASK